MSNFNSYAELSRRALIKMSRDFDEKSDDQLKTFVTDAFEKDENAYEHVRPIETAIECYDDGKVLGETAMESIKQLIEGAIDIVETNRDKLSEAGIIGKFIEE